MEIIFKDRIRALRQERGETQVQVAEAIGVAESHYQRFEKEGPICRIWKTSGSWRTTSASPSTIWWGEATSGGNMRWAAIAAGLRISAPAGAIRQDAPPILFWLRQKENAPRPVEEKSASAGRSAPAQTSCRRRGMVGTPLQKSGTETHRPWGILRPGEVQGYPCFSFRCRSRFRGEPASA